MNRHDSGSRVTDTAQRAVGPTIACISLCVLALWGYSPGDVQAADDEMLTLKVLPKLCVKPVGDPACTMDLTVTWEAAGPMSVCLRFEGDPEPLQCWQAQRQGEFTMAAEREGNTTVQMINAGNQAVLGSVQISVIERDVRDTRRRRRHAWSIL